jgi:hypothetical protein
MKSEIRIRATESPLADPCQAAAIPAAAAPHISSTTGPFSRRTKARHAGEILREILRKIPKSDHSASTARNAYDTIASTIHPTRHLPGRDPLPLVIITARAPPGFQSSSSAGALSSTPRTHSTSGRAVRNASTTYVSTSPCEIPRASVSRQTM